MTTHTILNGHVSPETAIVIDGYPYGGLRTQIRYWVETAVKGSKKGQMRFVSQTLDPKRRDEHWNNPKESTYVPFLVMYKNSENGHIEYETLYPRSAPDRFYFFWKHKDQLSEEQQATIAHMEQYSRKIQPSTWQQHDEKIAAIRAEIAVVIETA